MTLENIALFQAMGAKMNYLNQRQQVIAHNIANADTPNYRPRDLVDVDFGKVLSKVTGSNEIRMASTISGHLPPVNEIQEADSRKQKETYEVAPAGNAVIMEEQMVKATQNTMDFNLMTNLMRKNVGLIMTALGRQQ